MLQGKYPGKISGAQSAIFGIMENARGVEAASRANPWLFAGPGIGMKYICPPEGIALAA
jgi:hypothetical protein